VGTESNVALAKEMGSYKASHQVGSTKLRFFSEIPKLEIWPTGNLLSPTSTLITAHHLPPASAAMKGMINRTLHLSEEQITHD